jgi:hypothetical protein
MSNAYEGPKYELVDATSFAAEASNSISKMLAAFTDLRQTIVLRDLAIEELDRKLEALEEAFKESEQLKASYLEQFKEANARVLAMETQLYDAVVPNELVGYDKAEEAPLEQPHDSRAEGGFLRPPDTANDHNTDTTQHRAGNIFGADE